MRAQIRNETVLRKAAKLEFESVVKLGAMMHVNAGHEVDANRIQAGGAASASSVTGAVTQAVVEELVLILMMIILTSIIVSAGVNSALH